MTYYIFYAHCLVPLKNLSNGQMFFNTAVEFLYWWLKELQCQLHNLVCAENELSLSFSCLFSATSSAHLEDLAYLDDQQRHIPSRTSLRMPRQNSGSRSQQDHKGKHIQRHTHSTRHKFLISNITTPPLHPQFVSLRLSTWSPSTLKFPGSHLIGCSPAGSGFSKK